MPQASRSSLNRQNPSKTMGKPHLLEASFFGETEFVVFMDWSISDGSGGESYTVGRAESESEIEIAGKPQENQNV